MSKIEEYDMVVGSEEESEENIPSYLSEEWSDFVMTKFSDKELMDGCPTVVGLRRVAELLLGPVVVSECEHVQSHFGSDSLGRPDSHAVIKYTVAFDWNNTGQLRTYSGLAEVNRTNTDDLFLGFPVATAESRAEGRAYKKALKIRGLTADEIPKDKDVKSQIESIFGKDGEIDNSKQSITVMQYNIIKKNCKDCGIDVLKFINSNKKYGPYSDLSDVDKDVAAKMVAKLNVYNNDRESIPSDIKSN